MAGVLVAAALALGACGGTQDAQGAKSGDAALQAELTAAGVKPANGLDEWKRVMRENVCDAKPNVLELTLAMQKDKGDDATIRAVRVAATHLCPDRVPVIDAQIAKMT